MHYSGTSLDGALQRTLTPSHNISQPKVIGSKVNLNQSGVTGVPLMPGIFSYLPHLQERPDWLLPRFKVKSWRSGVEFVIAIPSIKRPKEMYVYKTVASLLSAMSEEEKKKVLIVVSINEVSEDLDIQPLWLGLVLGLKESPHSRLHQRGE